MKRDAYEWLFHASDAARQVLDELDELDAVDQEEDEEPEDHGESFGEIYAALIRGPM